MNSFKKIAAAIAVVLAGIYLGNPGAGIIELIPDNIPIAGNLDELVASLVILRCLFYLGVDPLALKKMAMRNVTKQTSKIETNSEE